MIVKEILNTGIANIDVVYGGIRGTTLSSHHNLKHWHTIASCGIRTVIDLRDGDYTDRLYKLCDIHNIRYYSFPMDSHLVPNETIAGRLLEFFDLIDEGDFYIACAMGLHRTDLALSIYWMFHGAEKDMPPPFLKGHISNGKMVLERFNNKVVRRLNSLYAYLSEHTIIPTPDADTFKKRKYELRTHTEKKALLAINNDPPT
jgi:hypothetical protein